MITIRYTDRSIIISGHAGYAEPGKDIVCAAVSTLVQTLGLRGKLIIHDDSFVSITTEDKEALQLVVEGLKQVADNYKEYVEVIERC